MKKKAFLSIIIDIILIGIIVVAVYILLANNNKDIVQKLLYGLIIVVIPTGFYITYNAFAGQKYDFSKLPDDEAEEDEENDSNGEK